MGEKIEKSNHRIEENVSIKVFVLTPTLYAMIQYKFCEFEFNNDLIIPIFSVEIIRVVQKKNVGNIRVKIFIFLLVRPW